jgi:hypothetical protein
MENLLLDADQLAPEKTDEQADTCTLADRERELDVRIRAIYGCSLPSLLNDAHELGKIIGRHEAAKVRKPPGRPCEINEHELNWLAQSVDTRQKTIPEAVTKFLTAYRKGQHFFAWLKSLSDDERLADPPLEPPEHMLREMEARAKTEAEAETGKYCNAYYRWKRRQKAGPAIELPPQLQPRGGNHKGNNTEA